MIRLSDLKIKIFADGAELNLIAQTAADPLIRGYTTNPTLMRKANVRDYRAFAYEFLSIVPDRPVSFEVFSDDFEEMERQAHEIASWGGNVYVKIPVTNTKGRFSGGLIGRLTRAGVRVNVTAIMTEPQILRVVDRLESGVGAFVSVFAGRIADTGRDPVPLMRRAVELLRPLARTELIWASPRELLNVFQAEAVGCQVITATKDLLAKLSTIGKDLDEYSLETVRMFYGDAASAGYSIECGAMSSGGLRS